MKFLFLVSYPVFKAKNKDNKTLDQLYQIIQSWSTSLITGIFVNYRLNFNYHQQKKKNSNFTYITYF